MSSDHVWKFKRKSYFGSDDNLIKGNIFYCEICGGVKSEWEDGVVIFDHEKNRSLFIRFERDEPTIIPSCAEIIMNEVMK